MAKKKSGPRRKAGERYPSGKLKAHDGPLPGAAIRRIFDHGRALGLDERVATQVGRLHLLRELTETQVAAAELVGRTYGRFERALGKRRAAKSPSYELGHRGAWAAGSDAEERRARAAFDRLQSLIPVQARPVVEALCVEDIHIIPTHLPDVIRVLDKVAEDFGLLPVEAQERRSSRIRTWRDRHKTLAAS